MKEIWVKVDPWDKTLVTTALESGAAAVVVPKEHTPRVKELGRIKTVSEDGDLRWGEDVVTMEITSADDQERIVDAAAGKRVIVRTSDWHVIPLENLVARTPNLFAEVDGIESARLAAGILEKGMDGLLITCRDTAEVRSIIQEIQGMNQTLPLSGFTVTGVRHLGMGDRVCVDTCSMMGPGDGILVGNSHRALFLVHAESLENPYVAPRPFRVNAGAVHAYVRVPGGRTRYLSELKAGDGVLGVHTDGRTENLVVGRAKVEKRPLLLVEAEDSDGHTAGIILQNAETIRLVTPEGGALSVVHLQPGDQVLGFTETGGRHFGHRIEETITER